MALSDDYWESFANQPIAQEQPDRPSYNPPTQAAANQKIDQQVQEQVGRNLQNAINRSQEEYYKKEAAKPTWSRMPYLMANELVDMPNQFDWDNMSVLDKANHLGQEQNKAVVNIMKSLPGIVASLPKHMALGMFKTEQSIYDLEMAGMKYIYPKISGEELTDEMIEKATGRGKTREFVGLGEVRGVAGAYEEGIERGFGPVGSAVTATGEAAGDLAMALVGANIAGGVGKWLAKPKWSRIPGTPKIVNVSGVDFQPLTRAQKAKYSAHYLKRKIVSTVTGNKNVSYGLVNKEMIKAHNALIKRIAPPVKDIKILQSHMHKITEKDVFVKVSNLGQGVKETSVVRLAKGPLDKLKAKYGKSKVTEGEMGPEIKMFSEITRYDPKSQALVPKGTAKLTTTEGMTKAPVAGMVAKSEIAGWEKMTDIQKAEVMGAEEAVEVIPSSEKIISALGSAKRTDPACVKSCRDTLEKYPDAIPERVIFSDSLENASKQYLSNIEKDVHKQLEGFTHIRANVGGKIIESKTDIKGAEPFTEDQIKKFVSGSADDIAAAEKLAVPPEVEVDPFVVEKPVELPSLMKKPYKGYADKPVNEEQVRRVIELANNRGLSDGIIQSTSKAFYGKININELTQQELYAVSETLRAFPELDKTNPKFDLDSMADPGSYFKMARNWMDPYEARSIRLGDPQLIASNIRSPITIGIKDSHYFQGQWSKKFDEVGGKYADMRYYEEGRLIGAYAKGDKDVILKNDALSTEAKIEMAEIGDWFNKYFSASFTNKDLALVRSRFGDQYLPEYRMLEGSPALYKELVLPPKLKVASQYERKGQLNVLEDNIFIVANIYAGMVGKIKFLKQPYDAAQKEIENLPPNVQKKMTDWVQETMGRSGEVEKQLDAFSKKLSKITRDKIPEDFSSSTIRRLMTYSYGAGLGLPRVMPVARNPIMQSFIFPFADFGPDYLIWLSKLLANPKKMKVLWKNFEASGLEVKGGVMYGSELGKATGRGAIGKTADSYERFSMNLIRPYGFSDKFNRFTTSEYVQHRFKREIDLLKKDKITVEEFERMIDIGSYSEVVQQMLREKFVKNTKQSTSEADMILRGEKLDQIQFPYRRGGASEFHHGLKGKALGQFTQYVWGFSTMIGEWLARGQYDKLVRLLGMGEAVRRTAEEELNIDVSSWTGFGPVKVPVSPMLNIMMGTTEEMQDILNNKSNAKAYNANYKKIMNAVALYGGPVTGPGVQRWKNVKYSVERYERSESGKSPFPLPYDASNPDRVFAIWTKPIAKGAIPSIVRTVTFGELLAYGFGFETMEGKQSWDASAKMKEGDDKKRVEIKRALNYFEKGEYEKFESTMIDNELSPDIIMNNIDSQMKSILQRHFESLSMKDKFKYYPLVGPMIYGE